MFATTALVMTAGVASAQSIALSGWAEMGVTGGSEVDSQFHTDIDVTFRMSGEADNGLTFGATIDLDEEGGFAATNGGPEGVFAAFGGFRLDMGDTDGGYDWALGEVGYGGSIADDHTGHAGFSGQGGIGTFNGTAIRGLILGANGLDGFYDGQVARGTYSSGGFAVAGSMEVSDDRDRAGAVDTAKAVMGLGATYTADGLRVGVGYQTVSVDALVAANDVTMSFAGASVQYAMSGITVGANISSGNHDVAGTDVSSTHMGIGASYSMNALTLGVNFGSNTVDFEGADALTHTGWGLSATYDLGGGLQAQFGYGSSTFDDDTNAALAAAAAGNPVEDNSTWSFGLAMAF